MEVFVDNFRINSPGRVREHRTGAYRLDEEGKIGRKHNAIAGDRLQTRYVRASSD